jgi:small subunit ribosomal protein S8
MSPIANMLAQIKNAQQVNKNHVVIPFSNMKFTIANILREEGFIGEIERKKNKSKKSELEYLDIQLKYDNDGLGAISGAKMVSTPSRRMYMTAGQIKPIRSGYGIAVLSTSKGVLSSKKARKENVGGEILFEIW